MNVYDKAGNLIEGTTSKTKDGMLFEINSKEHGRIVVRYGADGALDGQNDAILSIGGQTAAGNMEAGLNAINGSLNKSDEAGLNKSEKTGLDQTEKAGCPVCKGAGCKHCSGQAIEKEAVAQKATQQTAQQAAQHVNTPQITQVAATNPIVTNLIDKVENPINLTDANIKDLIAAIMLIINREVA